MSDLAACTVVAKSTLSLARVLARSFHEHHPEVPFFALLADEVAGCFEPAAEPFRLLRLADLPIPDLQRLRFRYPREPLAYAATPYLLTHLLDRGFAGALCFKQESLVVGDLAPVFALLDSHPILLTPHLLAPLAGADGVARELNILLSGVFNVGLLGVSATPEARRFLAWWQDRLRFHCRHAVGEGMHYEQRWIDLVPSLFDGVHIVRDPGANVGHWNLPERQIELRDGAVLVDGVPCRLVRFSGFEPERPLAVTRYSDRLKMADLGDAAAIFKRYRAALAAAGWQETRSWPYAYGRFDNGVPIPDVARELYLEQGEAAARFGDPFAAEPRGTFFRWLVEAGAPDAAAPAVNRLWEGVYRRRADVQRAFPDLLGADRAAFLQWTLHYGVREHAIPAELAAPRGTAGGEEVGP